MDATTSPKAIDQAKLDELRGAFADYLGQEIYSCGRVYEGWSHGTMSLEDFSLAREDDDILDSLVEIALEKLGLTIPAEPAGSEKA